MSKKVSSLISFQSILKELTDGYRYDMEQEIAEAMKQTVVDIQRKYIARAADAVSCVVKEAGAAGQIEVQFTIKDLRDERKV